MRSSRHAPSGSTSSLSSLPARFTVPPLPPFIHRRLKLEIDDTGLVLIPAPQPDEADRAQRSRRDQTGIRIRWGVKGKVESISVQDDEDDEEAAYIGGVLGVVRLWDAAYLLVILPARRTPVPLFSSHLKAAPSHDELSREAGPSSHEVYTVRDVHPIPLVPDLARKALDRLTTLQARHTVRAKRSTAKGLNIKWKLSLPTLNVTGAGAAPGPAEELDRLTLDSEEETDTDGGMSADGHSMGRSTAIGDAALSRESLPAPEADETPSDLSKQVKAMDGSLEERAKKRFSLGWGRFMPKLGKPGVGDMGKQSTIGAAPRGDDKPAQSATPSPASIDVEGGSVSQGSKPPAEVVSPANPTEESPAVAERPPASSAASTSAGTSSSTPFASDPPQRRELESKIITQIIREFTSGGFFYSFDFDLTHSLQYKRHILSSRATSGSALANLLPRQTSHNVFPDSPDGTPSQSKATSPERRQDVSGEDDFVEPDVHVPLWRRVDRRFFWNEALLKDLVDLGLHAFILPVMQGWVQSSTFTVPVPPNLLDPSISLGDVPVDLVVISRRSRERAGLRYQRRGIDDEGHVANMVETEMIVRAKVEGKVSLFSFVQVRGSIPLKWSQSPLSMKPPPVLELPVDQSYSIANLHFDDLRARYGPITIINLSEQTGKEAVVTNGYRDLVASLGRKDLTYVDFDFHAKCHGMKWENISELVRQVDFDSMGYHWQLQGELIREQNGAFRTKHALGTMLTQLGLILDPATSGVEGIFNDIWANNGDTISLCYAHTSALKGDFVRTGKRDFSGMLHDGVSSLSRMFYGAVSDYWAQAVISFSLGQRNLSVFSEFLANLESTDASNLVKLSRVRAAAVETSSARVLSEGEQRVAGWTLLSPEDRNVKLSPKLEEKVLLLTRVAIYVVSFNYALEKVIGFTRIPLASITSLQKGAYILSPLQEAGRDPLENESTRYSTYSLRNKLPAASSPTTPQPPGTPIPHVQHAEVNPAASEFFAFKVLPREFVTRGASTFTDDSDDEADEGAPSGETCRATVDRVTRRLKEACIRAGSGGATKEGFVVDKDVVSLAEAQAATSVLARMDYAVKRFLWL